MTCAFRIAKIGPRPAWWLPDVAVQMDFVNDRYYWGGSPKLRTNFAAFSLAGGCAMGASGLTLDGTATNFDISVSVATLGLSYPFVVIASATPNAVATIQMMCSTDSGNASNYCGIYFNSAIRTSNVVTGAVTEALLAVTGGTAVRTTIGVNYQTNNIMQSLNGSTGGAADTLATLPVATTFRVGERPGNASAWNGTIQHIVIYSGAAINQTDLNNKTAQIHALSR